MRRNCSRRACLPGSSMRRAAKRSSSRPPTRRAKKRYTSIACLCTTRSFRHAGRSGQREDDSASARDLVCASIARRASSVGIDPRSVTKLTHVRGYETRTVGCPRPRALSWPCMPLWAGDLRCRLQTGLPCRQPGPPQDERDHVSVELIALRLGRADPMTGLGIDAQ
jgi:hypothetical protein